MTVFYKSKEISPSTDTSNDANILKYIIDDNLVFWQLPMNMMKLSGN